MNIEKNLNEILHPLMELMEVVGDFQKTHFRKNEAGTEKSEREYVSRIDIESENWLKEGLANIVPDTAFFFEVTCQIKVHDLT